MEVARRRFRVFERVLGLMILKLRLAGDAYYRLGDHFWWIIPTGIQGVLRFADVPFRGRSNDQRKPWCRLGRTKPARIFCDTIVQFFVRGPSGIQ